MQTWPLVTAFPVANKLTAHGGFPSATAAPALLVLRGAFPPCWRGPSGPCHPYASPPCSSAALAAPVLLVRAPPGELEHAAMPATPRERCRWALGAFTWAVSVKLLRPGRHCRERPGERAWHLCVVVDNEPPGQEAQGGSKQSQPLTPPHAFSFSSGMGFREWHLHLPCWRDDFSLVVGVPISKPQGEGASRVPSTGQKPFGAGGVLFTSRGRPIVPRALQGRSAVPPLSHGSQRGWERLALGRASHSLWTLELYCSGRRCDESAWLTVLNTP